MSGLWRESKPNTLSLFTFIYLLFSAMIKAGTIRTTVVAGRKVVPRSELLRLAEEGDGSTCDRGTNAHEARHQREVYRAERDAAPVPVRAKRRAATK
jgi:hypothetical protein